MIRLRPLLHRLRRDRRGATILEFALVILPFMMILMGVFDFAYRGYVSSIVEGTVNRAARLATVGNKTATQIDDFVTNELRHFSPSATITITKKNYYQFSGVGKAEKLTSDSAPIGSWNTGDCYEDLNNNGKWDVVAGRDGLGGSDDVVYYQVDYTFPRVMPTGGLFGWSATQTVSARTIMRNQPYGIQAVPTVKCTSS